MFRHVEGLDSLPVTQQMTVTHDGESFEVTQLRGAHLQTDRLVEGCLLAQLLLACCDALGEGRRVEEGILWDVDPVVIYRVVCPLGSYQFQTVGFQQPLRAGLLFTAYHGVEIIDVLLGPDGLTDFAPPVVPVDGSHRVPFILSLTKNVKCQLLSKGSLILQIESDLHNRF